MVRRANLHSGETKRKRVYSSKYALSSKVCCSRCGEIYRRIAWNNQEKKSIVWRCCTRVEQGPDACGAPTIAETDLQDAVVKAINIVLGQKSTAIGALQENIEAVLQEDYDDIVEEIYQVREKKQSILLDSAEKEGLKQSILGLKAYLNSQTAEIETEIVM